MLDSLVIFGDYDSTARADGTARRFEEGLEDETVVLGDPGRHDRCGKMPV
jgi:hypothetical protein